MRNKKIVILFALLYLLTLSHGTAAPNTRAMKTIIGRIEQGGIPALGETSLVPDDCSGFELQYRPLMSELVMQVFDCQSIPEAGEPDGIIHCPLDAASARSLLENSYAVSIAPDGSVLWIAYFPSISLMFVQHNRTLVLMMQSPDRGVPDTDGSLKASLDYKLKDSSDPVEGEVRWSPDSRYVFFNDTERWHSAQLKLEDPYIADTLTGDIFLIDRGGYPKDQLHGSFRCVMYGTFSMDGKSFYWYCRSFFPDMPTAHSIMRYDLETGAEETVCELKGPVADFVEVKENCWFVLEKSGDRTNLIRMTVLPDGCDIAEELIDIAWESCQLLPAVKEKTMLAFTPLSSGGTYLLPLAWNTPASSSVWRKIGSVHDEMLREISVQDMETEYQELKRSGSGISSDAATGTANIRHAAAIIGVTDLLLTIFIREPNPDSWGGGASDFSGQVILDTESMKLYPVHIVSVTDGLQDLLIDGTHFLMKDDGQLAMGLFSLDSLPEYTFVLGESCPSPYGSFLCRGEQDPLVLSSVTLENRECNVEITAAEGGYTIAFHIVDHPEAETLRKAFCVPEVLTEERWKEITSLMNRKDLKKFSGMYSKITPELLENHANRDNILACYPCAAGKTIYILLDGLKASGLESVESLLASSGYTSADYSHDMTYASIPRGTNVIIISNGKNQSFPVRYSFFFPDPLLFPASGRIVELAGLCERIGKAVMANRSSAEPLSVESVILDFYDMGSVDFHVSVEHVEKNENSLDFSLSVIPSK